MLESALKCQKVFKRLEELDPMYVAEFKTDKKLQELEEYERIPPNDEDWDVVRIYVRLLKIFFDVTNRISGSLYVTSNTYFHDYHFILSKLQQWCLERKDLSLQSMASSMKLKHDKYWGDLDCINHIHFMGVVLDPRYKLKFVERVFENLFGIAKAAEMAGRVKATFVRLYDHYRNFEQSANDVVFKCGETSKNVDAAAAHNVEDECDNFAMEFMRELSKEKSMEGKSEVDRYLMESHEAISEKFQILDWWKVNSTKYKVLAKLAKDIFGVPITATPSKSAFSIGVRVLDPYRSSLSPNTVEALLCLKNCLRCTIIPMDMEESTEELEKIESGFPLTSDEGAELLA
ncbi:Zinc finger BED domain-containing protein RICESLEEPER 2-like [Quillaja saponaria]|uniref:Zinc finger BED domain-containing protein RICESLEEPER 2-like n=1 Tax=Quillaja saponaria TaxID=32244 RepID=A0AAD7LG57_QUISA|nr:Zinc finger BED domain-containing protein RICESLEEPER 2-like [Quillaja saponaria]